MLSHFLLSFLFIPSLLLWPLVCLFWYYMDISSALHVCYVLLSLTLFRPFFVVCHLNPLICLLKQPPFFVAYDLCSLICLLPRPPSFDARLLSLLMFLFTPPMLLVYFFHISQFLPNLSWLLPVFFAYVSPVFIHPLLFCWLPALSLVSVFTTRKV